MVDDLAFVAANAIALIGWVLLIALPRWPPTVRLAELRLLPLLIALIYVAALIATFVDGESAGDFFSLDGVARLVSDRRIVLVVWIHILVFDLFVGCHIFLDARARGVARLVVVPCLVATLLAGPCGLLAYRLAARRKPST